MKIFRASDSPAQPADPRTFAGRAQVRRLGNADEGVPVAVYHVRFEGGGRTNWHVHSGPQWLMIVEGRIRIQRWGEPPEDAAAGDTIVISPGEKHWHGAAPGGIGIHIAVNVDAATEWLEEVSDEQSRG
jgi:quercetin dioxygenase-like cupin family protein